MTVDEPDRGARLLDRAAPRDQSRLDGIMHRPSLRYRLRNPPPLFVGRSAEGDALEQALSRGSVAIAFGMGGFGKTSLVLHTIATRFPNRLDRSVMIAVRPGHTTRQIGLDALGAISEIVRRDVIGPQPGKLALDTILTTLIDLADELDLWVILDDLHLGESGSMRELLGHAAAYARRSRFIATSRLDPEVPELAAQVIPIGPMPRSDLISLARRSTSAIEEPAVLRAVDSAAGSPWRLQQLLAGRGENAGADDIALEGLPDVSRELLALIAQLELPVPLDAIAPLLPALRPDHVADLAQRGLIEALPTGIRAHDLTRTCLGNSPDSRRTLADALCKSDDPIATLEALRLFLADDRVDPAQHLLDERLPVLLAAGLASRLWQLLADRSERFGSAKLACAADLGGGPAVTWAAMQPQPTNATERLLWVRTLAAAGRVAEAEAEAAKLASESVTASEREVRFEAGITAARFRMTLGRPADAIALLERLTPENAVESAHRLAIWMRALVHCERYDDALALAAKLEAGLGGLSGEALAATRSELLGVYTTTGRGVAAWNLARTVEPTDRVIGFRMHSDLQSRAILCIEGGRITEARELLVRLDPVPTLLRPFARLLALRLSMTAGEFDGAEELSRETLEGARAIENASLYWWAAAAAVELAIHRATPPERLRFATDIRRPTGPQRPYLALFQRLHALRMGVPDAAPARDEELPDVIDVQVLAWLMNAVEALVSGELDAAATHATKGAELARDHGWTLLEVTARTLHCQALLLSARDAQLSDGVDALASVVAGTSSRRFQSVLQLLSMASARVFDPMLLERLASEPSVAPAEARKARALLGHDDVGLDVVDALVVDKIRERCRIAVTTHGDRRAFHVGWGVDRRDRAVWLPNGRRVELADRPVFFQLLAAIIDAGGAATKGELAATVWGVEKYHPLRDDKRMQVAVRRLRLMIEDTPSTPTRLVTTAEGYAFGVSEPLRVRA